MTGVVIDKNDQELKKQIVLKELFQFVLANDNNDNDNNDETKLHFKLIKDEILFRHNKYHDPKTEEITFESYFEMFHIDIISGGLTNYSFKISFPRNNNIPALYAKLSFETAFWNPNKDEKFDLQRTSNEYKMMKLFANQVDSKMIAAPYTCLDLYTKDDGNMKLLITKWCENDIQMANQFKCGIIDPRLCPKLAKALASLHSIDNYNENINNKCRDYFTKAYQILRDAFDADLSKKAGRTATLCQSLGTSGKLEAIYRNSLAQVNERECLIHNDFHFFNIIVEAATTTAASDLSSSSTEFGPDGSVTIVDWEMCMAGVAGCDIGHGLGYVLACAIAHALNGNLQLSQNCINFCYEFWDLYSNEIKRNITSRDDLITIEQLLTTRFKDSLGGIGIMAYCGHYYIGAHLDGFLPTTGCNNEEYVRDAIGLIGLTLLQMSFGEHEKEHLTYKYMRTNYETLIQSEIQRAYKVHLLEKKIQISQQDADNANTGVVSSSVKQQKSSESVSNSMIEVRRLSDAALNLLLHTYHKQLVHNAEKGEDFLRLSVSHKTCASLSLLDESNCSLSSNQPITLDIDAVA